MENKTIKAIVWFVLSTSLIITLVICVMVLSQGIKNREEKEKEKPSPYEEVSEIEVVTTNGDTVIIFTGVGSRCHLKKKKK
jgi:heme/copper-type cytochrome/quinol oxidase subunit 2